MISLKWKIQFWYASVLAGVLLMLSVGFYINERQHRLNAFDNILDQTIHPSLRELGILQGSMPAYRTSPPKVERGRHPLVQQESDVMPGGWKPLRQLAMPKGFTEVHPREKVERTSILQFLESRYSNFGFYIYAWDRVTKELIYKTEGGPLLDPPPANRDGYWKRTREHQYREIFHINPHMKVLVGFDLVSYYQSLESLKWQIAAVSLLIFCIGISVGGLLVAYSLRPLKEIEKTTAAIAAGGLQERIPESKGSRSAELVRLTDNLNHTFTQLESLFQKQTRFTADASHELRTPLTALMAQISLGLNRTRSPEEYEQVLKVCEKSSIRLKMIIEDLLDLSRYDSGSYKMEYETLSLNPLLESLADELRPYIEKQGSTLKTELTGGKVYCDPFRLEQCITNLINNALQHNPEPVQITLCTSEESDFTVIDVMDNGVGIQPENMDKLFDRFFQEDESRKQKRKHFNVGLGLSISQAIITAHGGTFSVTSQPNVETKFTIRIPLPSSVS